MYKTLFAVTQTIGNDERIIKTFSEKDEAISFGRNYSNSPHKGVITCIQADFDSDMRMKDNMCRVYEVFI